MKTIPGYMKTLVTNALRLAAERYDQDAAACGNANEARVALEFETQAKRARALADAVEIADELSVSCHSRLDETEISNMLIEAMR